MADARKPCQHKRGDWINEMGYWLCADCWVKLDQRPKTYGPGLGLPSGEQRGTPQTIIWMAEIAKADDVSLAEFLRTMTRRYMMRTRPQIALADAYDAAIAFLGALSDPYGDPAYSWDRDGAREMADEDMQHWEEADGGDANG